jgi:CubicO group peptidase (beta-lactamase class C family)
VQKICPYSYRHTVFVCFCLLILFTLVSACINNTSGTHIQPHATPTSTALGPSQINNLDHLLTQQAKQENFSGTVLIVQNGKILLRQGYGPADWKQNVQNTVQTEFRIANLTEQFNALAILLLQDQGKLAVEDPICKYISDCPDSWSEITIRQLLTRTSGITDYTTLPDYNDTKGTPTTPGQLIGRFEGQPLAFKTGYMPTWSTSDEVLLGAIIESASGESYGDYLQQAIFGPLHMNHTGYDQNRPLLPEHATGYTQPHIQADFIDISVLYAAGGIYSTLDDLYTFDQALINHKIGSSLALKAMFSTQWSFCQADKSCGGIFSEIGMGYGWVIGKEKVNSGATRSIYFDWGGFEGFSASNRYYPEQKLTVIWLSNIQNLQLDVDSLIENALFPSTSN